jgi:SAM-dependent methyltransferase
MSRFYKAAYAIGFTPWETAGQADGDRLVGMFAREEKERGAPGKALDLGCGSGMHLVTLAERGWTVTGVDLVDKALARARERVASSGVTANVVQADVTQLPAEVVGTGFDFFLDLGCFHGLKPQERAAMATAVTARANPTATLVMFAFGKPVGPRFMPQGATRADIEAAYADWDVVDVTTPPADVPGVPRMARKAQPTFYRLRRQP